MLVVERWILARLRNRKFFNLLELNHAVVLLLNDLNQRAFKKLPGCRRSAFEQLDAPALQPLPAKRFELFRWKSAKVNIDCHVEFDSHYYSVPHALVRTTVELRVTATLVECFSSNQRVACHALSHLKATCTPPPGATVDYEYVAQHIATVLSGLNVQAIAYDRWRIDLMKKEFDKIGCDLPLVN